MAESPDVRLELKGANLTVECGQAKHNLTTIEPADFPPFPRVKAAEGKTVTEFTLEDSVFRTLLAETAFAASTEEQRFVLCGSLIKLDGAEIHVVACDGRRIAASSIASPVRDRADLLVPVKTVRELLRLLPSDTDKPNRLQLAIGENQVQFVFGEITLLSKLIEGAYPDWNRIIPADNNIATLPRAEMLRSVERIALVADDIHLEFTGSALHLKSHGKRGNELVGDATDCLLIASNVKPGVPAECVFSARYLRDALAATADDSLEFHLAPTRLCKLKAPTREWRAVIAPVKKEEKKAKPEAPAKQPETPVKQAETPAKLPEIPAKQPAAVAKPRPPVVARTRKPELVGAV
jgi:DNA polymerase-3 subunit beta